MDRRGKERRQEGRKGKEMEGSRKERSKKELTIKKEKWANSQQGESKISQKSPLNSVYIFVCHYLLETRVATRNSGSKLEPPRKPPPKEMKVVLHLMVSSLLRLCQSNYQGQNSAIFPLKRKISVPCFWSSQHLFPWKPERLELGAENPESGSTSHLVSAEGKHHRFWTSRPELLSEKNNSWLFYTWIWKKL